MRIDRVAIENFRSIDHLECEFSSVTTLVGPNGAGKSTILRALEWFFNGPKQSLQESDRFQGALAEEAVSVRVDFADLTAEDRDAFGPKYCPGESETLTVWRVCDANGEKMTGKALAYPPFEGIRAIPGATDKRKAYDALRSELADGALPKCGSAAAVEAAMDDWERHNPDKLQQAQVSDSHFFGFNGQGKLAEIFDYVFVSADLRATEETEDDRDSIVGKILKRAIDRTVIDRELSRLVDDFSVAATAAAAEHLGPQLDDLSTQLSDELATLTTGRKVRLAGETPALKPPAAKVTVEVVDGAVTTPVDLQGHGFRRSLLVAGLTVLARRGRGTDTESSMVLAIEEPELFQHPTQARAFASVLRNLANDDEQRLQVAYATHSPYFVDPVYFDDVRRVSKPLRKSGAVASSTVTSASMEEVQRRLDGFCATENVSRRWSQVCIRWLSEALFAETVILVEGDDDAAVFDGLASVSGDLALAGTCLTPVEGKKNMFIPYAILTLLGIQTLMVVDNDSRCADRMRQKKRDEAAIRSQVKADIEVNRKLCRFVGADEQDWPEGQVATRLNFIPDTLESVLQSDLPDWGTTRDAVVAQGRGVEGKNAATYSVVAKECTGSPGPDLRNVLQFIRGAAA